MKRRSFIRNSVAAFLALPVISKVTSLNNVYAAYNEDAFKKKDMKEAMKLYFGTDEMEMNDEIAVVAPDIAENGAVVQVGFDATSLADASMAAILIEKNPTPLSAGFKFTADSLAAATTRVKMGNTSDVYVAVKVGDKLYASKKEVKVTIGGCGG